MVIAIIIMGIGYLLYKTTIIANPPLTPASVSLLTTATLVATNTAILAPGQKLVLEGWYLAPVILGKFTVRMSAGYFTIVDDGGVLTINERIRQIGSEYEEVGNWTILIFGKPVHNPIKARRLIDGRIQVIWIGNYAIH